MANFLKGENPPTNDQTERTAAIKTWEPIGGKKKKKESKEERRIPGTEEAFFSHKKLGGGQFPTRGQKET